MKYALYLLLVAVLSVTACKDDCETWQEGDDCTEMREKFYGTYAGTVTDANGGASFSAYLTLTPSPDHPRALLIEGIINAEVSKSTQLKIPRQTLGSGSGAIIIEGAGVLNGNTLTFGMEETDSSFTRESTFTGVRQ